MILIIFASQLCLAIFRSLIISWSLRAKVLMYIFIVLSWFSYQPHFIQVENLTGELDSYISVARVCVFCDSNNCFYSLCSDFKTNRVY